MLDTDRLQHLRSDLRDLVNLNACVKLFNVLLWRNGHVQLATSAMLETLRSTCLSILDEFDGEARWADNVGSIALEVARQAHHACDGSHISNQQALSDRDLAQAYLTEVVANGHGSWSSCRQEVENELWPVLESHIEAYGKMSPFEMLNHVESSAPKFTDRRTCDPDYVTRRIAHLGTLHWRIWAPLLYLRRNAAVAGKDSASQDGEGFGQPPNLPVMHLPATPSVTYPETVIL